jgi:hypothetical protein
MWAGTADACYLWVCDVHAQRSNLPLYAEWFQINVCIAFNYVDQCATRAGTCILALHLSHAHSIVQHTSAHTCIGTRIVQLVFTNKQRLPASCFAVSKIFWSPPSRLYARGWKSRHRYRCCGFCQSLEVHWMFGGEVSQMSVLYFWEIVRARDASRGRSTV